MKEADFLKRIRERKSPILADRQQPRSPHPGLYPGPARTLAQDLVAEFKDRLAAVGGYVYIVSDAAAARVKVRDILDGRELRRAVVSNHVMVHDLELDVLVQRMGLEMVLVDGRPAPAGLRMTNDELPHSAGNIAEADLGLTGAEYAIAASGTLVMAASPYHARTVSLLPPLHIAIIHQAQLLPDLAALATRLRRDYAERPPSGLALITGPSRTADIEQTLSVGVHGPRELHVLLGKWITD
jgi:L-lactate dehydrogenase complex protein LldG